MELGNRYFNLIENDIKTLITLHEVNIEPTDSRQCYIVVSTENKIGNNTNNKLKINLSQQCNLLFMETNSKEIIVRTNTCNKIIVFLKFQNNNEKLIKHFEYNTKIIE